MTAGKVGPEAIVDADSGMVLVQDIGERVRVAVRLGLEGVRVEFDAAAVDELIAVLQDARERVGDRIDAAKDHAGQAPARGSYPVVPPRPAPRHPAGAQS